MKFIRPTSWQQLSFALFLQVWGSPNLLSNSLLVLNEKAEETSLKFDKSHGKGNEENFEFYWSENALNNFFMDPLS